MRYRWILLLFSGLMLVSTMSCGSALSSPPANTGATSLSDTPADKPTAVSPTVTGAGVPHSPEAGIRQPTAVTITRTQPDSRREPPIMSSGSISIPLESASQQVVTQARKDLARRLRVPVDSITVDAFVGREFSTDAFYCRMSKDRISKDESPQGMSGQSILLSASAHRYEYHASGPIVIFCRPLP